MGERSERDERRIALAKAFLKTVDERGDLSDLVTEDLEMTFPKWGTCHGVKEFPQYFGDLGGYIAKITHHPETFICLVGDDHVAIEGFSSGELTNGARWPDKEAKGAFCTVFAFRGDRISQVRIHIDPDYADATADHYAWRRARATAA
jgi:ketosteroid isomerase-like protein